MSYDNEAHAPRVKRQTTIKASNGSFYRTRLITNYYLRLSVDSFFIFYKYFSINFLSVKWPLIIFFNALNKTEVAQHTHRKREMSYRWSLYFLNALRFRRMRYCVRQSEGKKYCFKGRTRLGQTQLIRKHG